jgi:hypothetical protein
MCAVLPAQRVEADGDRPHSMQRTWNISASRWPIPSGAHSHGLGLSAASARGLSL